MLPALSWPPSGPGAASAFCGVPHSCLLAVTVFCLFKLNSTPLPHPPQSPAPLLQAPGTPFSAPLPTQSHLFSLHSQSEFSEGWSPCAPPTHLSSAPGSLLGSSRSEATVPWRHAGLRTQQGFSQLTTPPCATPSHRQQWSCLPTSGPHGSPFCLHFIPFPFLSKAPPSAPYPSSFLFLPYNVIHLHSFKCHL